MADAIVGVLAENLNSIIQREIGLLRGVADDMKKFHSTLTTIQAVLEDAESKKIDNKPIENWLAKLKDASFEATDLLEEWANDSSLSCFNLKQLHFRCTIAKKTQILVTRFNDIAEERLKFHLDENVVRTCLQLEESRESGSILAADVVYGRDNDKKSVIRTLCNNMGSGEDLFVLPIIGMGGLGKTTLAQWVYNDHRVSSHFEKKIWVCVSDNFEVKGIMKMMLESLNKERCDLERLDTIERQLEEKLRAKKFLLVLDDVWNEDEAKWMKLKSVLKRCGARGNSILVTTRLEGVASIMGWQDYRMNRDHLIQLWMANGYLQSDGRMEPESLGKLIFDELLHRAFFQERKIEVEIYDKIETCKMHDLMQDLACSMSVNECSVVEVGREDAIVKCTRQMSLVFDLERGAESSNRCRPSLVKSNSSMLRTLILLGKLKSYIEPALVLENLYSLRALEMIIVALKNFQILLGR